MEFARVVDALEAVEATTKRLEKIDHLAELFREADPATLRRIVYLAQGMLGPDWEGLEPGLAGNLVVEAIDLATGLGGERIDELRIETGDLGSAAARALEEERQQALFREPLTVASAHGTLVEMAEASGEGSQDRKVKLLARLLNDADPPEARMLVRAVMGKMRLGIGHRTILDALAEAFASREDREAIERADDVAADLGAVAEALSRDGLAAMDRFELEVGRPVRPMLAERSDDPEGILEKMPTGAAEYKYDGLRVQAHLPEDGPTQLFSRRLEEMTGQFPDVVEALEEAFQGSSAIVEGECVAVDPQTGRMRPFQYLSHRRGRKHDLEDAIAEVPVRVHLFDLLHVDGEDMTREPFPKRREALEAAFEATGDVVFSELVEIQDPERLDAFFEDALDDGAEGVMVKDTGPDSTYRAGARGWQWVKYKRDYRTELSDTLDLVVVGALAGEGRRAGLYGALLVAAYDPEGDRFETVCRVSTGFSDETLEAMPERFEDLVIDAPHPRVASEMEAEFWFVPEEVVELHGSDITLSPVHTAARGEVEEGRGLSLRFPRFHRFREDKGPADATTTGELVDLYRRQVKVDAGEE